MWDDTLGWCYDEHLAAKMLSGDSVTTVIKLGSNSDSGSGSDSDSSSVTDEEGGGVTTSRRKVRKLAPRIFPRSKVLSAMSYRRGEGGG